MMYRRFTSFLFLTVSASATTRNLQSDTVSCILANPEDYSACCQDDPDSAVCTYIACEMGAISEGCDCTTMVNFCNSLETVEDIVVPEICAPSVECCSDGMSVEDFRTCVSEKGGDEIVPTSFFELNGGLVVDEISMSMSMSMSMGEESGSVTKESIDEQVGETEGAAVVAAKVTSSSPRCMAIETLRAVAAVGFAYLIC